MSEEEPYSMLDVQKNVMTETLCLNSTKSDWDTATQDDKKYLVEYCTGRLNMRSSVYVDSDELYKEVDKLFRESTTDDTAFLDHLTNAYQIFQKQSQL